MIASPIMGPTTAPAIQALLDFFFFPLLLGMSVGVAGVVSPLPGVVVAGVEAGAEAARDGQ